jgi:hypothetical protein
MKAARALLLRYVLSAPRAAHASGTLERAPPAAVVFRVDVLFLIPNGACSAASLRRDRHVRLMRPFVAASPKIAPRFDATTRQERR